MEQFNIASGCLVHNICISFQERCTRQQKKIEDLEQDNIMLSASRNDLYSELKKVHETNEKLRARNVGLSHDLHLKSRELTEVKELWDRDRGRHEDSVRQLERLQVRDSNGICKLPKIKQILQHKITVFVVV